MSHEKIRLIKKDILAKEKQEIITERLNEAGDKEKKVLVLCYLYKTEPKENTEKRIDLSKQIDEAKDELAKYVAY